MSKLLYLVVWNIVECVNECQDIFDTDTTTKLPGADLCERGGFLSDLEILVLKIFHQ